MRQFVILISLFISFSVFAQNQFYLQGGIGLTSITSYENNMINVLGGNIDGELIYDFQEPISVGLSTTTGYGFDLNLGNKAIYQQENLNIYYRVFFFDRVIVGGGFSAIQIWNRGGVNTNDFLFGVNLTVDYKIGTIRKYDLHLRGHRSTYFSETTTGIGILLGNPF